MMQAMGRLVALQYREKTIYMGNRVGAIDALRVHIRCPDGEVHEHDLPNQDWSLDNAALQFMAKWGYQPSGLDTYTNVEDDTLLLPVVHEDGDYLLAQRAMSDARAALEDAEWFDPSLGNDGRDDDSDGPNAGPGPDPGTGNRGGVDHSDEDAESGVSTELAPEDSDQGVTVTVE